MRRKYSQALAQAVEAYLNKSQRDFTFNRQDGKFLFHIFSKHFPYYAVGQIHIHDTDLNLYGLFPLRTSRVSPERVQQLLVFLTYANHGLRSGNFELAPSDGLIRYKCYLDCSGPGKPADEMLQNAIRCIELMFDRYGLGIRGILKEGMDNVTALTLCDSPVRGFYSINNEATPAESAESAGIDVAWDMLYDELEESDYDTLTLLRDMYADDNII